MLINEYDDFYLNFYLIAGGMRLFWAMSGIEVVVIKLSSIADHSWCSGSNCLKLASRPTTSPGVK
jgi:hypothetical protein